MASDRVHPSARPNLKQFRCFGCVLLFAFAAPSDGQDTFTANGQPTAANDKVGALSLRDTSSFTRIYPGNDRPRLDAISLRDQLATASLPSYDVAQMASVGTSSLGSVEGSSEVIASMPSADAPFVLDEVTPVAEPCTWFAGALTAGSVGMMGLKRKKTPDVSLWLTRLRIRCVRVLIDRMPVDKSWI